ncbi:hypothetical protein [Spongiimicrobium sp. 3-5]|uniref:hypothetical protein n=1 Tax=Spongiimicrobium sp. 3-5 TaxID=3332596 RepID=UPI00398177BA
MRNIILALFGFYMILSCTNDDGDNFGLPEGTYRLVERVCFCGPPEEGSTEHWIFDNEANTLTIRIVDGDGELIESRELFYGSKGNNLVIGEGAEFVQKRKGSVLELTYLDDPGIADDEVVVRLVR